jgi:hypothetical protein
VSGASSGSIHRRERVQAEEAAEQHAEHGGDEPARDEQARHGEAVAEREAGGGGSRALADVAEHVAEHQRTASASSTLGSAPVAARHSHRAAEDLNGRAQNGFASNSGAFAWAAAAGNAERAAAPRSSAAPICSP